MGFFKHPHLLKFSDASIHKCALCCLCGQVTDKKAKSLGAAWVLVQQPDEGTNFFATTRNLGRIALHATFVAATEEICAGAV
eukprot:gene24483-10091_t